MKVYIPKHLRTIPIINKLYNIIDAYSKWNHQYQDSFSDYQFSLKTDPVLRFLGVTKVGNNIKFMDGSENYTWTGGNSVVRESDGEIIFDDERLLKIAEETKKSELLYLTTLFYSVKGTYVVFEYLKKFDVLKLGKITYTTKIIKLEIEEIPGNLEKDYFCDLFEEFLAALLYFEKLYIIIDSVKLDINAVADTTIGIGRDTKFIRKFEL